MILFESDEFEDLVWDAYEHARMGRVVEAMIAFAALTTYCYKYGHEDGMDEILDRIRPH